MPIELNTLGVQIDIPTELDSAECSIVSLQESNKRLRNRLVISIAVGITALIILNYYSNNKLKDYENNDHSK
jgi:hypothetical protein